MTGYAMRHSMGSGDVAREVVLGAGGAELVKILLVGGQKQSSDPGNNQHILNTPIIWRR